MFERFTDRARRAVVLAQEEARRLGHRHIAADHLLLGVVADEGGIAARAVASLGVPVADLVARVRADLTDDGPATAPAERIPFTHEARRALELSLREALGLGHSYIGTEHLLLGLVRQGEGIGCGILADAGADLDAVRARVRDLVDVDRREREAAREGPAPEPAAATAAATAGPVPEGEPPGPRCPHCRALLATTIGTVPLEAGGRRVLVVVCGACSTALGILPG